MSERPPFPPPYVMGFLPPGSTCGGPVRLRPGGGLLSARAIVAGGWRAGQRVLDLGCGRGESLAMLCRLGIDAIGIDPAVPPQSNSMPMIQGRGDCLPFPSASFDGVLAECCLSVMDDPEAALAEVARVLKPGAPLVVTDVYARGPIIDRTLLPACLSGIVAGEELARRVERAGLRASSWEDHSEELKQLIGRVLFEHGSLAPLWGGVPAGYASDLAIRQLRPGYLLMAALRPNGASDPRGQWKGEHGHG
jgi:arsenite methyltransferase